MPFLCLGRGWNDEMYVSDFAAAAYDGKLDLVQSYLEKDSELKKETIALYLALRGGHQEIFSYLVAAGIEIHPSIYAHVLYEDPKFLSLLPKNEEVVAQAKRQRATAKLCFALLREENPIQEVMQALEEGAQVKELFEWGHHFQGFKALQYAARKPNFEIIQLLLKEGADPDEIVQGKNVIRTILENRFLPRAERKAFLQLFKKHNSLPWPPLDIHDKIAIFWGNPIAEKRDDE